MKFEMEHEIVHGGLGELRQEGMKMKNAARSGVSNLKGNKIKDDSKAPQKKASNKLLQLRE